MTGAGIPATLFRALRKREERRIEHRSTRFFLAVTIMKAISGAACAVLFLLASGAIGKADAQTPDAFVLPTGQARLRVGGDYSSFDSRYDAAGEREPLGAVFGQPLTSVGFAPLAPLATELGGFLTATDGGSGFTATPVNQETLTLGTPDVRFFESEVRVPFEVALGILPHVEVAVGASRVRGDRLIERFTLTGGTLGENPDPEGNAAVLASIDEAWATLGGAGFLPVDSSSLGKELQRRVVALSGRPLALPSEPADTSVLRRVIASGLGVAPLVSGVDRWRMGDATVTVRALLLSSLGGAPLPTDSTHRFDFRSALSLGLRLPTGAESDTVQLVPFDYELGRTGFSIGWNNDIFVSNRFWMTLSAGYSALRPIDVRRRLVAPDLPFSSVAAPITVRQDPGDLLAWRIAPRLRLADAVAIGVDYGMTRRGATSYTATSADSAGVLDVPAGTSSRWGIEVRYSSLPAYWSGDARLPVRASLGYSRALSGAPGEPANSIVSISVSWLPRLWGHGARRSASPAASTPEPAPPVPVSSPTAP